MHIVDTNISEHKFGFESSNIGKPEIKRDDMSSAGLSIYGSIGYNNIFPIGPKTLLQLKNPTLFIIQEALISRS